VRQNLALVLGLQGKYEEATEIASRDQPPAQAQQRVAAIRNMVQLDPVAPPTANAIASVWNTTTSTLRSSTQPTVQSADNRQARAW
ncbi:MAG: hypothetical protein AAF709_00790, partial [Pseudomonadota bacterium]